jgi:LysM repeat protein
MNRIETTILTLSAAALLVPSIGAEEPNVTNFDNRISALEARLESIEGAIRGNTGSYSYQEQATLDATNNSTTQNLSTSNETYVIQEGDSLGSIARKHEIERADLLAANRLSEGQPIYIGETLVIPGVKAPAPAPAPAPASEPPVPQVEEKKQVAKNDSKPAPAREKSVVIGETKKAPAKGKSHMVGKGDTLTSIASRHGTDVKSLESANGLRTDVISIGQVLTIPGAPQKVADNTNEKAPELQAPKFQYDNPLLGTNETYGHYTVKKGDNLYALARDFFTNMGELQRLNRLGEKTLIYPGNDIIVPTSKYNEYHNSKDVATR